MDVINRDGIRYAKGSMLRSPVSPIILWYLCGINGVVTKERGYLGGELSSLFGMSMSIVHPKPQENDSNKHVMRNAECKMWDVG